MKYLRYALWGLALGIVVWWVSDRMIGTKQEEVEPRVRNVSSQKIDRMLAAYLDQSNFHNEVE